MERMMTWEVQFSSVLFISEMKDKKDPWWKTQYKRRCLTLLEKLHVHPVCVCSTVQAVPYVNNTDNNTVRAS